MASLAELRLGAGARIIDVDMPEFSVALPSPSGDPALPTTVAPGTTAAPVSVTDSNAPTRWHGADALFLGCERYESPATGLACRWSGPTPLVLVGLVADPAVDGVVDFAVLYARTAV